MTLSGITDVRKRPKPVVLAILDGWGVSPSWTGNAISQANPQAFQYLWTHYPHVLLKATVDATAGSSEIGHASLGTGRLIESDLEEINQVIQSGRFFSNPTLRDAMVAARDGGRAVHLAGLLSPSSAHGSSAHAAALVRMAKDVGVSSLFVHVITDGRDAASGQSVVECERLETTMEELKVGRIATVMGRLYAMDRAGHWDRTERAYQALNGTEGLTSSSATEAIRAAQSAGQTDDVIVPTRIGDTATGRIAKGDTVIFWNVRADRMEQLVRAIADPRALRSLGIWRKYPVLGVSVVTMTDYHLSLPNVLPAFASALIETTIGALLANHGLTQLHVAETEKYAHVTYFFNGGRAEEYEGEQRLIVRSPRGARYDTTPAMNASGITRLLERAVKTATHDFIVVNFSNVDAVAHTGNLEATTQAVLVVDEALRRLTNVVLDAGGVLLVTADHGAGEALQAGSQGTVGAGHSLNPVPFIHVTPGSVRQTARAVASSSTGFIRSVARTKHTLADVAPTILEIFGIPKPNDMTGTSLLDDLE